MTHHFGEYDHAAAAMAIFQRPFQHHFHHDTHPATSLMDRDVLNGRGQGVQRHPGNVKYRTLVLINKTIYAKCSSKDKIKISKGIVDAVRTLGGSFLKLDERTGTYHDIGDKKAKDKTSQALREGQTLIRKALYQSGELPNASQQKEVSAEAYFGYSVQVLDSLWRADENAPAMKSGAPSPPSLPHALAEAVAQPTLPHAPVPAAVPSASTIDSVNFCSPDLNSSILAMAMDQFPGLVQTARNEAQPVANKVRSNGGARPGMQRVSGQRSFKAEDLKQSVMPFNQSQLPQDMPPLPAAIQAQAASDDSRPSIRLTNMSLASTSSVACILESMRNTNKVKAENARDTIESVMGEIDELSRQSEQRMTQVLSMTAEEMNETFKLEDEQVVLKNEDDASHHSNNEFVFSDENNMMERISKLRFSEEDYPKPDHSPLFTSSIGFIESSRLTNYSTNSLMGASVMTFGINDLAERPSRDGPTAAV